MNGRDIAYLLADAVASTPTYSDVEDSEPQSAYVELFHVEHALADSLALPEWATALPEVAVAASALRGAYASLSVEGVDLSRVRFTIALLVTYLNADADWSKQEESEFADDTEYATRWMYSWRIRDVRQIIASYTNYAMKLQQRYGRGVEYFSAIRVYVGVLA